VVNLACRTDRAARLGAARDLLHHLDWQGSHADSKVWDQIQQLLVRHDPEVERDTTNEGHFVYGTYRPRTVYFNDGLTLETKLDAIFAEHPDLAGVAIWRLGGEDPANWDVLREWQSR
jgi:hypothetical protein